MTTPPATTIRSRFITIARAEGLSFIVLLAVAMPLKYLAGYPEAVRVVGWIHGLLFVAYMLVLGAVAYRERWRLVRVAAAMLAALLPFGTFVFEARALRTDRVA